MDFFQIFFVDYPRPMPTPSMLYSKDYAIGVWGDYESHICVWIVYVRQAKPSTESFTEAHLTEAANRCISLCRSLWVML